MEKIDEYKSRLDELEVGRLHASNTSLGRCRSLRDKLRKLKREVLAEILKLRTKTRRQAQRTLEPRPTLKELWRRRGEGVGELFQDVKERVTGDVDEEDLEVVEAWGEINREVDARLSHLEDLEEELAEAAGEKVLRVGRSSAPSRISLYDTSDDDIYAAVGAESRERRQRRKSCSSCGERVEADDKFCGECGARLD